MRSTSDQIWPWAYSLCRWSLYCHWSGGGYTQGINYLCTFFFFFLFLLTVESSESQTVTGLDGWCTGKEEIRGCWVYGQPCWAKAVATTQCGIRLSSLHRTVIVKIMHSSTLPFTGRNVIMTMGTESVSHRLSNLDESITCPCSQLLKQFPFFLQIQRTQMSQIRQNCMIIKCAMCLWDYLMFNSNVAMVFTCRINFKRKEPFLF